MNTAKLVFLGMALWTSATVAQAAPRAKYAQNSNLVTSRTYSVRPAVQRNAFYELAPVIGMTTSTFSGIKGTDGAAVEHLSGTQAGIGLLIGDQKVQFETGLQMAERGAKLTFNYPIMGVPFAGAFDYKLKYAELPLFARYSFQPRSKTHFFVKGGVIVASLIEASSTFSSNLSGSTSDDRKEAWSTTDQRLAAGLGVNIRTSRALSIALQVDYHMGLKSVRSEGDLNMYNSSTGVTAGLTYSL